MKIAYVIYPGFTALDLIGPCEILSRWPDADIEFVSTTDGRPVATDLGMQITPTATPESLPRVDMVVVPGASDPLPVLEDERLLAWLRQVAPTAEWMVSVCTGAGIYAAAGLLEGRTATTHWAFRENLKAMGVTVVADRVVFDGHFVSGAGVSAGIDLALTLTAKVHGEEFAKGAQLMIEYDPQPPFDTGAPEKADASTLRLGLRVMLGDRPFQQAAAYTKRMIGDRGRRLTAAVRAR